MKKIFVFLLMVVSLISGCSFDVQVITPAPLQNDAVSETQVVELPIATVPAVAVTPVVGFTPVTSDPVFYAAHVALDQNGVSGHSSFPAGTKQVFAIWHYQNMRAGLTVKREWHLDGKIWLMREEPWDFAEYGASGIMQDISIYDMEVGLPSGAYQLKVFIDNVQQPIGSGPAALNFLNFVIQPSEAYRGVASPNFQWSAEIYGEMRILIRDQNGNARDLYNGLEIAYLAWFADSTHILVVDRDRSGQQPGATLGIRDDLWIADVVTRNMYLLYESDTAFSGYAGPIASPDGKYIASLEGSGFGDACFVDSRLIFFEMANDYKSAKVIKQEKFTGLPSATDGVVYPVEDGTWQNNTQYLVSLNGTCEIDKSKMGSYLFDVSNLTASKLSATTAPSIPGDLGRGTIHGKIVDAVTGSPIAGAIVTCAHNSYTSPATCSGTATTNAQGIYTFGNVFFHDTDTVKLTAQANGYQEFEYSQNAFTVNDLEANISLTRLQ